MTNTAGSGSSGVLPTAGRSCLCLPTAPGWPEPALAPRVHPGAQHTPCQACPLPHRGTGPRGTGPRGTGPRSGQAPQATLRTTQHLWPKQRCATSPRPDTIGHPGLRHLGVLGQSPCAWCLSCAPALRSPKPFLEHRANCRLQSPSSESCSPAAPVLSGSSAGTGDRQVRPPGAGPGSSPLAQPLALFPCQCEGRSAGQVPAGAAQLGLWQLPLHPAPLTSSTQLGWPSTPAPGSGGSLCPPRAARDGSQACLQPHCRSAPFLETLNPASPHLGAWCPQRPPCPHSPTSPTQRVGPSGSSLRGGMRMLGAAEPRVWPSSARPCPQLPP